MPQVKTFGDRAQVRALLLQIRNVALTWVRLLQKEMREASEADVANQAARYCCFWARKCAQAGCEDNKCLHVAVFTPVWCNGPNMVFDRFSFGVSHSKSDHAPMTMFCERYIQFSETRSSAFVSRRLKFKFEEPSSVKIESHRRCGPPIRL
jgi:hypothetical protein